MSDTATLKTVNTKETFITLLDAERVKPYNFRLNDRGKKIISRMNSDNEKTILTTYGYNFFKDHGLVHTTQYKDKNGKTKVKTTYDNKKIEILAQETFYTLVDLEEYPAIVSKFYAEPKQISIRSRYTAKKYFEALNEYGNNRLKHVSPYILEHFKNVLDDKLYSFFVTDKFKYTPKEFFETGKWLTHIKTGSLSGYPANEAQTKEIMQQYVSKSIKVFEKWQNGDTIDWYKLAFEMGFRTERNGKHRVVCMAALLEKPISAAINTMFDEVVNDFPIELPRKYGSNQNVMLKIRDYLRDGDTLLTKDFEAFDKNIPLDIFYVLLKWFKGIDNLLCQMIAFELDLIIHCVIIVGKQRAFEIAALPSGIGITQLIGSIIHAVIDIVFEIQSKIAFYQSDDNVTVTTNTPDELNAKFALIKKELGMTISPVGEKTYYDPKITKFLQKVMDFDRHIIYNQEQRCFTNGLFRERMVDVDTKFEIIFGLNKEDQTALKKKSVLAYLGNLVAYEIYAPSLPKIFSFMYGKASGFSKTLVEWGLTNLEEYLKYESEIETHKLPLNGGWCKALFEECLKKGYTKTTSSSVKEILGFLGRDKLLW